VVGGDPPLEGLQRAEFSENVCNREAKGTSLICTSGFIMWAAYMSPKPQQVKKVVVKKIRVICSAGMEFEGELVAASVGMSPYDSIYLPVRNYPLNWLFYDLFHPIPLNELPNISTEG